MNWEDARAYAEWLSERTDGLSCGLPSESEWEYAARAETNTEYWWGDEIRQDGEVWANCNDCGSQWDNDRTAPVGSFKPNTFGVHDTAGNVWEWVQDCYHGSYESEGRPDDGSAWEATGGGDCKRRVLRGGSWVGDPDDLRSAGPRRVIPDYGDYDIGFRLVCRPPSSADH